MDRLQPAGDGRWTEADHRLPDTAWLWTRGNTGEVFPNVVTPLSSSLYLESVSRGQSSAALAMGMVTHAQARGRTSDQAWFTGIFGGYLFANVSLARAVASRTPGLTTDVVDVQAFGLSDAPPHRKGKGEIEVRAVARTTGLMVSSLRRPDVRGLAADRRDVAAYVAACPPTAAASVDDLLTVAASVRPWTERMMRNLLLRSARAGFGRSIVERLVARLGDADLVNRLTAGLGTIESAEPAHDLWALGRTVAAATPLGRLFDTGAADLEARLRAAPDAADFVTAFDAFRGRHGARGPDEWELCSATWSSDPALALGMIDRLRHAPAERDPSAAAARLAAEREPLARATRAQLPRAARPVFDRGMRAAADYAAQREATKAAFMRATDPARRALAELARRSAFAHDDFFLLRFDELPAALASPDRFRDEIEQRRARRDALQERMPPFWFDGALPDPSTWEIRRERRRPDDTARVLHGMAVCPGRATGPARIVTDPFDPRGIEPGDVLVAPITDPAWTPLFLAAAGVVVDVGAQQSHAAIVARELGIPAVVSATGASATIPDGARITVDGTAGTVTVH